jgi:hypothetical protein
MASVVRAQQLVSFNTAWNGQDGCGVVSFLWRINNGENSRSSGGDVCSCHGGEPGSHPDVAILRWNTTDNALELSLSEFSGLVACIDELGAYNDRKFSSLLYNITSGRAKVRLDKSVRRRKPVLWKMNILSSGEMSIPEKLASHNEQLQGGQEHRAISLNILPEDAAKEGETVVGGSSPR